MASALWINTRRQYIDSPLLCAWKMISVGNKVISLPRFNRNFDVYIGGIIIGSILSFREKKISCESAKGVVSALK